MQIEKLIEEMRNNPKNVRFEKLSALLLACGFTLKGGKGSHRVYIKSGMSEIVNIQNVSGKVKPYQVKQVLRIINKYSLLDGDTSE
jgi:predicted RNA binding protein YcfA (HicA-like mRNA interferase family)